MKTYRQIIQVGIILVLLILIPLLPIAISKVQDKKMINHLQIENIVSESTDTKQESTLSITEKLNLIIGYSEKDKNIILTTTSQNFNTKSIVKMTEKVNTELTQLHARNLLTYVQLDDTFSCDSLVMKKYSNAIAPEKTVSIYEVYFFNDHEQFSVVMDASTNIIYSYTYYTKTKMVIDDGEIHRFAKEYLNLDDTEIQKYRKYRQLETYKKSIIQVYE